MYPRGGRGGCLTSHHHACVLSSAHATLISRHFFRSQCHAAELIKIGMEQTNQVEDALDPSLVPPRSLSLPPLSLSAADADAFLVACRAWQASCKYR